MQLPILLCNDWIKWKEWQETEERRLILEAPKITSVSSVLHFPTGSDIITCLLKCSCGVLRGVGHFLEISLRPLVKFEI